MLTTFVLDGTDVTDVPTALTDLVGAPVQITAGGGRFIGRVRQVADEAALLVPFDTHLRGVTDEPIWVRIPDRASVKVLRGV